MHGCHHLAARGRHAPASRPPLPPPLTPDFFVLERKYRPPMSTWVAFVVAGTFTTAYVTWAEHCASINGKFPYPFLTIMSFEDRAKIYAASGLFALLVFRGLNALHK